MIQNPKDIFKNKTDFELFFKEQYSALCRFAFGFLKDTEEAEEVVQNSFVKLWNDRDNLNIKSSLKAYIYASVRNACLNHIKHTSIKENYKQYNQINIEKGSHIDGEIEANELQEKINIAIENMPLQRKKVFILSRFEGLKYKEIAEQLGISVKTVENHMGSAIKYLRFELKDYLHLISIIIFIEGIGDKLF